MKKIGICSLLIFLMLFTVACGKEEEIKQTHKYTVGDSKVGIYYPEDNRIVCDEEIYQIKQPDSISASVEEIMSVLDQKIDDNYVYHTYMLDEQGNLTLSFALDDKRDNEYELLMKAAVSQTIFQLDEINRVSIDITTAAGETIEQSSYGRESFYFYDYDPKMGLNKRSIVTYHSNTSGDGFDETYIEIEDKPDISMVEQIIVYLEKHHYIPSGTKIKTVSINSGVCYLELSEEFLSPIGNVKSNIVIYSIVNSLTQIEGINKVKLYISGMNGSKYRDSIDLSEPLVFSTKFE